MATNQNPTVESILSAHGFASIDDAREANVIFGCFECGSIKCCTPAPGETREEQRDALFVNCIGIDECCDPGDNFIL